MNNFLSATQLIVIIMNNVQLTIQLTRITTFYR